MKKFLLVFLITFFFVSFYTTEAGANGDKKFIDELLSNPRYNFATLEDSFIEKNIDLLESEYVYIVTFKDEMINAKKTLNEYNLRILNEYDAFNIYVVVSYEEEMKKLKENKNVEYIEKNDKFQINNQEKVLNFTDELELNLTQTTVNPPLFTEEEANSQEYKVINVEKMWEAGHKGNGVNIAVLDTGLGEGNGSYPPDINENNIIKNLNCTNIFSSCYEENSPHDEDGHGTHVTGIIASQHNDIGIKGISPNVKIHSYKVLTERLFLNNIYILSALNDIYEWNEANSQGKDIHIVNMSFSNSGDLLFSSNKMIKKIYEEQDVLFVAATGNDSINSVYYPAAFEEVIAVGSVNVNLNKSAFSNFGEGINLTAPGESIKSTYTLSADTVDGWFDGYGSISGTSQATPIVSGYLALLKEQFPNDSAQELREKLFVNTIPRPNVTIGDSGISGNLMYGNGILQAVPYGVKYQVEINETTNLYQIPYDDNEYITHPEDFSGGTHDVYLEWNDYLTKGLNDEKNGVVWLKIKINKNYYWVKKENLEIELFKNVKNRSMYDDTTYAYKLFDGSKLSNNYAIFGSYKKLLQRFETPVTVTAFNPTFRDVTKTYNFQLNLYDENKNLLQTKTFQGSGLHSFTSPIRNVYYAEIVNNANSTADVTEFELLGHYFFTKDKSKDTLFNFTSSLDERAFYEDNSHGRDFEKGKFRTVGNLAGKKFKVTKVYDWNETKQQYNWLMVSNEELDIANEWIQVDATENVPIYKNDLTEQVYGRFVKSDGTYADYLINNATSGSSFYFNQNNVVDYEFDVPVLVNGYYLLFEPSTLNPRLEITFYKANGETKTFSVAEKQLFERYNNISEPITDVKKVRIKNLNSRMYLKEFALFGEKTEKIGLESVLFEKPITIPKGSIVVSDNPNGTSILETKQLNSNYTTQTMKGFGLNSSRRKFDWVLVKFEDGDEKWVSTTLNAVTIDPFEKNGLIDMYSGVATDYYGVNRYNLGSVYDNLVSYTNTLSATNGHYVTISLSEATSVKAVYFARGELIDDTDGSISIHFYDKSGAAVYSYQMKREDLYREYFVLPEVVENVKSFKLIYHGTSRVNFSEIELF